MPGALVTHAHSRAAVAGIRALGAGGVPVIALGSDPRAAGLWSRHIDVRALGPESDVAADWTARIGDLARRRGPLVVYPGQEEGVGALVETAAMLPEGAILAYPGPEPVRAVRDKGRLSALAAAAGIGSPPALAEGPAGAIAASPPDEPCVVKARDLSVALPAAVVCAGAAELSQVLEALPADEPVVVQPRLDGPLVAVSLVLDREGTIVARFQQRALRLWPVDAGASSLGVSVPPDDDLVERIAGLLRAAGYWGLAQVQLLDTPGGPSVIDVNPRFYGSLPLPLRAGVNLPLAWHAVALGERPPAERAYRTGVTYRWLEGELTAARNGDHSRLWRRGPRPRVGAMWDWRDPVPGLVLAADIAAPRLRRLRPGG